MAYAQISRDQLVAQVSELLDDPDARFWTRDEIILAINEGLRTWGAYTSYWRERGSFSITPAGSGLWSSSSFPWSPTVFPWQYTTGLPWYDLSVLFPTLRTRSTTLDTIVREIQFALLEPASGIAGTGMSGQVTIGAILQAIARARNRFVLDSHLPYSVHANLISPSPMSGEINIPQYTMFIHRAAWLDLPGGVWTTLWREDSWAADHADTNWTVTAGTPRAFTEAEDSPLQLGLIPPPTNEGLIEAITVDSVQMDLTDPAATFAIPDEWIHAVKWAALSDILSSEGQIKDGVRASYAEARYTQAVSFAADARSILRVLIGNRPMPLDTITALDRGDFTWRNQSGAPKFAGAAYDLLTFSPGVLNQTYGAAVDVARTAPLPAAGGDFIQLGSEDINNLLDYVSHVLTFKCGGKEFTGTFGNYNSWLGAVAGRKGINRARVRYLDPLFGVTQREWAERPERVGA
jgi:hypothetical protein